MQSHSPKTLVRLKTLYSGEAQIIQNNFLNCFSNFLNCFSNFLNCFPKLFFLYWKFIFRTLVTKQFVTKKQKSKVNDLFEIVLASRCGEELWEHTVRIKSVTEGPICPSRGVLSSLALWGHIPHVGDVCVVFSEWCSNLMSEGHKIGEVHS